jgi:hypothetical protein
MMAQHWEGSPLMKKKGGKGVIAFLKMKRISGKGLNMDLKRKSLEKPPAWPRLVAVRARL